MPSDDSDDQPSSSSHSPSKPPVRDPTIDPAFPDKDSVRASSDDSGLPEHDVLETGYDSHMATRIGDESDSDEDVERLRKLHEGRHRSDGEHSTREASRDKTRIAQAIVSSLPLTSFERDEVVRVTRSLDFERFGQQRGLEGVVLGVVAVVVDEENRQEKEDPNLILWSDEFRDLCDEHDVSMSDLSTIKQLVRERDQKGQKSPGLTAISRMPRRDPALPDPLPPGEKPDEYWDELSAQKWEDAARNWKKHSEEWREAVPDEYRELIDLLRRWEPWEIGEDPVEQQADELIEAMPDVDEE